jgi:hypothetical protein
MLVRRHWLACLYNDVLPINNARHSNKSTLYYHSIQAIFTAIIEKEMTPERVGVPDLLPAPGETCGYVTMDILRTCNRLFIPSVPADAILQQLQLEYQNLRASNYFPSLYHIISEADSRVTISFSKIVAFAHGSMSNMHVDPPGACPWNRRRMVQHAFIKIIQDLLFIKHGRHVPCFAQDPEYTSQDKYALLAFGIDILEDPMGFIEADEHTVVISHAPTIPVKQIIADIVRPAMIIWDRVPLTPQKFWLPYPTGIWDASDAEDFDFGSYDPVAPRVVALMRGYRDMGFPIGLTEFFLHSTSIHVRQVGQLGWKG